MAKKRGTSGNDRLNGTSDNDTLSGLAGNDQLFGLAGNDRLDGGRGADRMSGGLGNDTYIVDSTSDKTIESTGQGRDTVRSSVNLTLAANIEDLVLLGSANLNGTGNTLANDLTGKAGHNALSGGGGDDNIDGGAGSDTLSGGSGNDRLQNGEVMRGGPGNDKYFVDATADQVSEDANAGNDTVETFVSFTLPANVEILLLNNYRITGTGNAGNNIIQDVTFGPSGNVLHGGDGNDALSGGFDGNARLFGDAGNDTLSYGSLLVKIDGGTGTDRLNLNADQDLDLTAIANTRITGIEIIDLTNAGANLLTLNVTDVLALSSTTDTLRIDGDAADVVSSSSGWTRIADTSIGGVAYHQYILGAATLLIDTDITPTIS